jgi:ABC-type polysaccharide/polyol phosphate export permease
MIANFLDSPRARGELSQAFTRNQIWRALAASDIRSKYRMSTFGSLWITLATGTLALSIGLIYGQFFGQDIHTYLPYFTASYVTWLFIASVLSEGSQALISAGNLIKSSQMPIIFHVMRVVQRNMIVFGHNAVVLVAVWLFIRWPIGFDALLVIPGILLLFLFLSGLAVTIAVICVRYRDIPPLIQVMTQFLFFITPVIWQPEQLRFGKVILELNPMAYMLMIVRDPVLGRPIELQTWVVASLLTLGSLAFGAAMYIRFRNRIAYWV